MLRFGMHIQLSVMSIPSCIAVSLALFIFKFRESYSVIVLSDFKNVLFLYYRIVLPMHVEKRTLLKSPHINKKHRVQFELRTHARMLQVGLYFKDRCLSNFSYCICGIFCNCHRFFLYCGLENIFCVPIFL